ncbi:MAG: iron-sulfur cluster repair di-iron protein [Acidimicrobiales bacterium]|nr:iron-sulfur cluster repair di-iron protein [Acidimicrobiales bacterium]
MTDTATPTIDAATTTLAQAVTANPGAARVFDKLGLDFCCHGKRSIAEASAAAGLDPALVVAELGELAVVDQEWSDLEPAALVDHIVETHHDYLHEEMPLLVALAAKVASVHGERHPELAEVSRLTAAIQDDLDPHLTKEERILFPAIKALTEGEREFPFGPIANPIRMMMAEHDGTGELLEAIRAATNGYAVPADGCASYQSLYQRLEALEADTHLHVHKENHHLFPTAIEMAES